MADMAATETRSASVYVAFDIQRTDIKYGVNQMHKSANTNVKAIALGLTLAIGSLTVANAAPLTSALQTNTLPPLVQNIGFIENSYKREAYYRCCWRYLRGQSLIGMFCGKRALNQAFARDIVRIVTSNGRKVCTMGRGAFTAL